MPDTPQLRDSPSTAAQALAVLDDDLSYAFRHVGQAQQAAARLIRDYCFNPAERAAIALVTRTGRAAELWLDLCAELAAAEKRLSDVLVDVEALNDALDCDGVTDAEEDSSPSASIIPFSTDPAHTGTCA